MSSDELKVPSQRHDVPDDDRRPEDRRADEPVADEALQGDALRDDALRDEERRSGLADDEEPARAETVRDRDSVGEEFPGEPRTDRFPDEPVTDSPRTDDEYAAAVPGAVAADPVHDDDVDHRDPYAKTGVDMPAEPPQAGDPVQTTPYTDTPAQQTPYAETPAHAAPEDIILFDQDPSQVQARWRDLQAAFVDDPGEAVNRADGLVSEVVDSLTSSLNSRTSALRDRWKGAEGGDTEQLRLALRDYRNVLERLLAISGKPAVQPAQTTSYSNPEMR